MATITQLVANKQNASKSTGPTTNEGKTKASQNALRHGVLSDRLLLDDESYDDYEQLLDGLMASLRPVGTLELALVERIAISLWRQRRLIRAETAGLELARCLENAANRQQVETALGRGLGRPVIVEELQPLTSDDVQSIARISNLTQEHDALDDEAFSDPDKFAESAPMLYEELRQDAAAEETTIPELLSRFDGGMGDWVEETMEHYRPRSPSCNATPLY
jgi:hypothetical protein